MVLAWFLTSLTINLPCRKIPTPALLIHVQSFLPSMCAQAFLLRMPCHAPEFPDCTHSSRPISKVMSFKKPFYFSPSESNVSTFLLTPTMLAMVLVSFGSLPPITVVCLYITYQTKSFLKAENSFYFPSKLLLSTVPCIVQVHSTYFLSWIEPTSGHLTNGSLQIRLAGCATPASMGVSKNTVTKEGWFIVFPKSEGGFGTIWPVKIKTVLWREIGPSFPCCECWWRRPVLSEQPWIHTWIFISTSRHILGSLGQLVSMAWQKGLSDTSSIFFSFGESLVPVHPIPQ